MDSYCVVCASCKVCSVPKWTSSHYKYGKILVFILFTYGGNICYRIIFIYLTSLKFTSGNTVQFFWSSKRVLVSSFCGESKSKQIYEDIKFNFPQLVNCIEVLIMALVNRFQTAGGLYYCCFCWINIHIDEIGFEW